MEWTTPLFAEIKMDAEIGSYQEDHQEREQDPFFGVEVERESD
jgi:hypothetical protein